MLDHMLFNKLPWFNVNQSDNEIKANGIRYVAFPPTVEVKEDYSFNEQTESWDSSKIKWTDSPFDMHIHDTTIDFNNYLHETRTIKVANVKGNNGPLANTATMWGWLTTYHWDDNSVTQEYRDAGGDVFWRATNAAHTRNWQWHKYANQDTVDQQQKQINDLIDTVNFIKNNYLLGKRFPANQEAQAQAWENANPNGIAMIEK